ncbi:PEP-CTERM sorting domain-containing protein [Kiritimatiellaeota bacterium B1221]|nr:PEP-CTERM sorting domain-containing protein [Kiritimatiellaeota bacterium B1221]
MNKQLIPLISLLFATLSHAQIISNGTGGGVFTDDTTWLGAAVPTSSDSWTVQAGDTVTHPGTVSLISGANALIEGTLNLTDHLNVGTGGGTLTVDGTYTSTRIFTNASSLNSTLDLELTSGTLSVSNRLFIENTNTDSTKSSSITLSGGTLLNAGGYVGIKLYSADADSRASLNIMGNDASISGFSFMELFNTGTGFEDSATDLTFKLAAGPAGAGAVTVLNTTHGVTLGGNAFEVDFTDVERPLSGSMSYSTTLIDYGSLSGTFGTLTSLGLGAGESAFLENDGDVIKVNYTLAAIPEPSSLLLMGMALGSLIAFRKRK